MVTGGYSLCQLAQIGLTQQSLQLRLTDQHDMQQLMPMGLQIGQQPHLLQYIPAQILCLIDNDNRPPAQGMSP